ncbi:MAG: uracil phosphoribosyltransferase [Rhodothermales bacterium]
MSAGVTVVDHPLLGRDLTRLRRATTPYGDFRQILAGASAYLAYEALRTVRVRQVTVQTPLEPAAGIELDEQVVVVPILRAGLGMVDGFIRFLPDARVGHLGMYRDETTHNPVDYYANYPEGLRDALVVVVDPMLATGGSACGAIQHLKDHGARRLIMVSLVSAPEGIERLHTAHPDVHVVTAAIDRELDANAFIRPGLGDAGDRIFGTS